MPLTPQPEWMDGERPNCVGQIDLPELDAPMDGDELFAPTFEVRPKKTERAKRVCNGEAEGIPVCPVRDECLLYALENDEDMGVWGGTSPSERKAMVEDYVRKAA